MASELTERYEELNLVYHTEDQVNYFAEGQEALEQLVDNCCEYLDVGLAALINGIVCHPISPCISQPENKETCTHVYCTTNHYSSTLRIYL